MNNQEMLDIFTREVRYECEWTRMQREVLPKVVRHTNRENPAAGGSISWSDLDETNADAVIQSQKDYFQSIQTELEWKYYSYDNPGDLPQRLLSHGFTPEVPEALMVAELSDLASSIWSADTSIVKRVTTPAEIDAIIEMENQVWDKVMPNLGRGLKYDLEHNSDHISIFAIWQDGRVVSAAWMFYLTPTSFATLWGGTTLKEYRGRGFYTSLLAVRAAEARQRGYRFLQVDASPDSRPILEKHGFRCLGFSTPFIYQCEP